MDRTDLALQELGQSTDLIGFVIMEHMLKQSTKDRTPDFVPTQIIGGGLGDWRRGRQVRKDVNRLCDEMWMDLVRRVMTARNDLVEWEIRSVQREREYAEQLRHELLHFETVEKKRARFYHELEMEKIQAMNQGADPAWKVDRTITSFDAVFARLGHIAQSNASAAEKNQQATLLIESIKAGLHARP